ncbi:LacI family transcriptional regulator [Oscillochloris sp. ZM17-4]|uniref:LacI family DNA-binding transcriptional regulator n=1 Tax=Oscillochloris sp. ZM17-4 TaxID=2866714 RepID=UPI001C73433E|nr:LacI family DNA-binding transcriptional regulator [Oscillochloris sp. ZM17-4]MBX0327464.1 LacI family transcriptional regulator [Oscillochloris sp. ZM17-4]
MPTIDDIARIAQVSPATVSKVVNNRPYVSAETRARVERVIAETGFVPSQRARGLSRKRSSILGLIIPYTSDQLFLDPHLLELMRGIEAVANEHDYNLLLSTAREAVDAASACVRMLRSDMIDGAIIVETNDVQPFAAALAAESSPWVVVGYAQQSATPAVHADDYGGALQATRHLLRLGHRRIGVISSVWRPFAIEERERGIRDALSEAGVALDQDLMALGDFSIESGGHAGRALLEGGSPPTAIFALNDRMALGLIRAAADHGLRVPDDLSVVGFDDISLATLLTPALTTVSQPGFALGTAAASALFQLLDGAPLAPPAALPTDLIVRGSTGQPRDL